MWLNSHTFTFGGKIIYVDWIDLFTAARTCAGS